MAVRVFPCLALVLVLACGVPAGSGPPSNPVPAPANAPPAGQPDQLPPPPVFSLDPDLAFRQQKMPLYVTGVPGFLHATPEHDGRGVLIAILDSGIDAGVPGLDSTSTGTRKLLDLRDFSGEGRVPLEPVRPTGDTVLVGGVPLAGFGRVVLFNAVGPWYGGLLREIPLGSTPGADVDANGRIGDSLPVIVTRASDGWILLADTDRDGSLAGERPVHDYLEGFETFGWAPRRRAPRLTVAVNLREVDRRPVLDLFFDTSGHGTHVAGIAAGFNIYRVAGFHGVAPGAQLLGLKIANDAQGGLSTTGSMLRALEYAIRFAAERRLPLVVNLSFGVGNREEGQARIDRLVDSVLARHPEVVFTVSAGNDGPGLTTLGFPGSARRAITVGGVLPGDARLPAASRQSPVAFFSARGGELAKPDLTAPGTAYSTVPLWQRGKETSSGTSMAAPHVAGLAALLVSGLHAQGRVPEAALIRQALTASARADPRQSYLDQGAGLADVGAAWRWLLAHDRVPQVWVQIPGTHQTAAWIEGADTAGHFLLLRPPGASPQRFTLRSSVPWLTAPGTITFADSATVTVGYRRDLLPSAGAWTGMVTGWAEDTTLGPVFRLVNTIVSPPAVRREYRDSAAIMIAAGAQRRIFIPADSGRPFEAAVTVSGNQPVLVFLHEPGGQPARGQEAEIAGTGQPEVSFRLDGRDVIAGNYQVVMVAPPSRGTTARLASRHAGLNFDALLTPAGVAVRSTGADDAFQSRVSVTGASRRLIVGARGSDTVAVDLELPAWAARLEVDLQLPPPQWNDLTDFGMSLFDAEGRQLKQSPLDYPFGRMTFDRPPGARAEEAVTIRLFPAWAEPGSREPWTGTMQVRYYADRGVELAEIPGADGSTPPGARTTLFRMSALPWTIPPGFDPLALVLAEERGIGWTREVVLTPPGSP